MAQVYKFFNSGVGDPREYEASDFADVFGSLLSTGILSTTEILGMSASVEAGTLNTIVTAGKSIMKGHMYENTSPLTLTHSIPEASLDRIDRIVLRLDLRNAERNILLKVKEGEPSASPVAPILQRDNFIYEISMAQIRVRKNTVQLLPADLIDERLNEDLCGLVTWTPKVPTDQFQKQWDEFMAGIVDSGFASGEEFAAHKVDYVKHPGVGTTTNSGNAYAVVLSPAPTAYVNSMGLVLTINANSTAAATVNVNGLGAIPIKKANGNAVTNLKVGGVYTLRYSSSSFILQGEGGEYGTVVAADVLAGKTFGRDDGVVDGTMTKWENFGTHNLTSQGASFMIPRGYHDGAGRVQATYVEGKRFAMGTIPAMGSLNLVPTIYLPFVPKTVIVQCMQGVSTPNGAYATKDNSIYKVYSEQFHFGQSSGLRGTIILDDSASFVIAHTADNYPSYAMNWIAYE